MKFDRSLFKVTTSLGTVSLFSLAIPMLLEAIMNNLLGTVSTLVLSGYSQEAVTAVGTASSLIGLFGGFFVVIGLGATVVISHYIGAEDLITAKEGCFTTILLCTIIGLIGSLFMVAFRYPILAFMNIEGQILEDSVCYFSIRMGFFVSAAFYSTLSAILRCYGHALSTVIGGLTVSILNVILSIYVIYFPEYSPITGVAGVATACIVSQFIGLLIFIFLSATIRLK